MRRRTPRRALLVGVLVVLAVAVGQLAGAFWSAIGSGTETGTTGTGLAVTLSPGTPDAGLYPGGRADVVLTVSNPNESSVFVGSLRLDASQGTGGYAVDAAHSGCEVSALSYTTQTNGGAGWTVPARTGEVDGTLSIRLRNALAMGLGAADACQGATIRVYLAVGP